ncbi:cobyric acid synthase [Candidatus Laterigemmans baculatus]|uniref:cobyric acid synthase n=1 Tax=Candidatus Laterigemmans baculatus TaxID=2770505 RepID=UPI0013DC7586|nr:cobyric acid synthase [Candidatus Laterigemmans baculatus]
MIQGTGSSAGKSLLTAGLCRVFARRGLRVAPFKAQNMSNNAMVCDNGAEIGRSQALQALAAGVPCRAVMNPVLLKPEADSRSQVIINGKPWETVAASDYYRRRDILWPVVTAALDRLRESCDLVLIEGAGSPAELNFLETEIVNMAVARYADSPVLLVGDIERGGVFAQLLGTLWLLDPEDRKRIKGLVVNKFRGDLRLFDRGVEILEQRGSLPVLGVLPWLSELSLPEEDGLALNEESGPRQTGSTDNWTIDVAVVQLPHISNFDDFNPLAREPGVHLRYARSRAELGRPSVVILPGTKNTLDDLGWLRQSGLAERIGELAEQGTVVVGICGGYQMLGRRLLNPAGLESSLHEASGLGLLPVDTVFAPEKQTYQVRAEIVDDRVAPGLGGAMLTGYEIHSGRTHSPSAWLRLSRSASGRPVVADGARSEDGRVWGCYVHGLFDNDRFRRAWLSTLGLEPSRQPGSYRSAAEVVEASLDRWADHLEAHLDLERLEAIVWDLQPEIANVG